MGMKCAGDSRRKRMARTIRERTWRFAAYTGVLLAVSLAGAAGGQPGGLFAAAGSAPSAAAPAFPNLPDEPLALRRRLVTIDFGQLPLSPGALGDVLALNLFDDAVFMGVVERTVPTFSGGYALSGRLLGVEWGTMMLVVNGGVVAGTIRLPGTIYRVRPAGDGWHTIIQINPARLPLDEPIPRRRPSLERPPAGSGRTGRPAPR